MPETLSVVASEAMCACVRERKWEGGREFAPFPVCDSSASTLSPIRGRRSSPLETPEASSGVGVGWLFRAECTTTAPPARRKEWTRLVLKGFLCQLSVRRPAGDLTDLKRRSGPITSARS